MDVKKNNNIKKDILTLFIFASGNTIFFSFGAIFPYTFTYCKHFDDSLRMSYFLYNLLGIFTGLIIGGYIVPYLFFIFGIKKTMLITAILYLVHCFIYVAFTSVFYNLLMTLLIGIIYQFQICSLNYYLSSKYENGIQYSGYCYLGQNLNMFITPIIVQNMMNPDNKIMDQVSYGSGDEQVYFNWQISSNYPFTMKIIGIYSFTLLFLGYLFVEEIESLKGNSDAILSAISARDMQKLKSIFKPKEIEEIKNNRSSLNITNRPSLVLQAEDQNNSLEQSLTEQDDLSDQEAERLSKKIFASREFLVLVLLMAFKNGSLIYYGNLIKAPVMATLNNDKIFAQALTFSSFADLANKIISQKVWANLGFYGTYMLHNILATLLFVLIYTFEFQSPFFVFLYVSMIRLLCGMAFIYSYNFLYSSLNPKIANFVAKILESNYIIGIVFWFAQNSVTFSVKHLYTNLYLLIPINLLITIIFATKYKDYKLENELNN